MRCTKCINRSKLILTGFSEEVNKRAEWHCPVCGQEYWRQHDGSLDTTKPEPKPRAPLGWKGYVFTPPAMP